MIIFDNPDHLLVSTIIRSGMSKSNAEEKKGKAKIPNGYDLNPQLMEQLSVISPENLFQFMMGNPEIVPDSFNKKYWKNAKSFGMLSALCGVGGFIINMVATRALPKILILPTYARIPLRFVLFGLPFLGASQKLIAYKDKN